MAERGTLPKSWELPEAILNRFGDRAGKQRLMRHEGHLLVILHAVPDADDRDRDAVFFWRNPDGDWKTNATGSGMSAMRDHVQAYTSRVMQLDKALELANEAEDYYRILSDLAPVCRAASHMAQVLQALREAVQEDKRLITLRDDALDVERESQLLMEEARHAMDFAIARKAEEQAKLSEQLAIASHRLNLLAALFFPVTALASIFGMNLASGLEDKLAPWLFWVVLIGGMAMGAIVAMMLTPKQK